MKLSPPPYQYEGKLLCVFCLRFVEMEIFFAMYKLTAVYCYCVYFYFFIFPDGIYVLLKMEVTIPPNLTDRVLLHRDLSKLPERPWSLSGPQYSGDRVFKLQQRYCTPKGDKDEFRGCTKASMWTLVDTNGEENHDMRLLHVYYSKCSGKHAASPKRRRQNIFTSKQLSPSLPSSKLPASTLNDQLEEPITSDMAAKPKKTSSASGKERQTTRSWTEEEDTKLAKIVGTMAVHRIAWNILAHQMGDRSGKQCRERYTNHLKPDRKKGMWTEEEDKLIMKLQLELGNQWARISAQVHGRSDNDVKNRWHSKMRYVPCLCFLWVGWIYCKYQPIIVTHKTSFHSFLVNTMRNRSQKRKAARQSVNMAGEKKVATAAKPEKKSIDASEGAKITPLNQATTAVKSSGEKKKAKKDSNAPVEEEKEDRPKVGASSSEPPELDVHYFYHTDRTATD